MGTRANVLHGISSVSVDGADIGFTEGGVEIEKGLEVFEKEVDQVLDALELVPTKWMVNVRTSFAESTFANLKIIWNEPAAVVVAPPIRSITIGYQQTLEEHEVIFVGSSPEGYTRTYTLWRAVTAEASAHTLQKGDKIVLPVTFRCLPDFDRSADEYYGQIVDVTAP